MGGPVRLFVKENGVILGANDEARARFGDVLGVRCREVVRAWTPHGCRVCEGTCANELWVTGATEDREVVVEGEHLRLVCTPTAGGAIVSLHEAGADAEVYPLSSEERSVLSDAAANMGRHSDPDDAELAELRRALLERVGASPRACADEAYERAAAALKSRNILV